MDLLNIHIKPYPLLSVEDRQEIKEKLAKFDTERKGCIDAEDLREALTLCGVNIAGYQSRALEEKFLNASQTKNKGKILYEEFEKLIADLKSENVANTFRTTVSKKENVQHLGGTSTASNEGTTHFIQEEEQIAFSGWINVKLRYDPDLNHLLPIDAEGKTLYDKIKDGILFCKIINYSCPGTIDERAINKEKLTIYRKLENLTLALSSASAIGCNVTGIDAHNLEKGVPHLVLGFLWQIIRNGLFSRVTLRRCPSLTTLLSPDEEVEVLLKLSPEEILVRWVNYHLECAKSDRRITNFQSDIVDSEVYSLLIKQIAPFDAKVNTDALRETDLHKRAEIMLKQAAKLKCHVFVTPKVVVSGLYKLNLAFVANLFNNYPELEEVPYDPLGETREERTYRNWINSMGVRPRVNWLYSDLTDGLIVLQLYDIIKPGSVKWSKVHRTFNNERKKFVQELENCDYVVELGKDNKFSLVGIGGQDINKGNVTLTLSLVWQLMRAYTLSVLTQLTRSGDPIADKDIVQWANNKLKFAGKKSSIASFQDPVISNARVVIDLIDAIRPGVINYKLVEPGYAKEDKLDNAKYAISIARKIGAKIYALPEDITEVKPKMVMTVFACLMALDYKTK